MDLFLWTGQMLVLLVALPFMAVGKAGQWLLKHPYYAVCRYRRRLAGEPEWKPIDGMIGIPMPGDAEIVGPYPVEVDDEQVLPMLREEIARIEERVARRRQDASGELPVAKP